MSESTHEKEPNDQISYEGAFVNKPPFTKNYADRFLVLSKGKGSWLWDREGKKYLDFGSGIAVNSFGHGRKDFGKTVAKQMETLAHTSNLFTSEPTLELARRLCASSPLASDQPYRKQAQGTYFSAVHLGNSGSEANETALKYARIYAKRKAKPNGVKFLAFYNSFHGRTMGALSVTHTAKYREPSEPLVPGVEFLPYNDVVALGATLNADFAAVIVEPIQGEGGLTPMTQDFAAELSRLCKLHDVVLIADEIQTGLGRTGTLFASEAFGLEPDIITLAKPLAGGIPASATLVKKAINDAIHPGDHGSTFGGNPVAAALAARIWDKVSDQNFLADIREKSVRIRTALAGLGASFPWLGELKGRGLLIGLEIDNPASVRQEAPVPASGDDMVKLLELIRQEGMIALRSGQNVLRLAPPLNYKEKEASAALDILTRAFHRFEKA